MIIITRWKNGVPNTKNNLRDDPLNPRLDIGRNPLQNPSLSHKNAAAKQKRTYIHARLRCAPRGCVVCPKHLLHMFFPSTLRRAWCLNQAVILLFLFHVFKAISNNY
jgi:hypothetical protein